MSQHEGRVDLCFLEHSQEKMGQKILPLSLLIWVDVTLVLETYVYNNVISCKTRLVGLCEPGAPSRAVGGAASAPWLCRAPQVPAAGGNEAYQV